MTNQAVLLLFSSRHAARFHSSEGRSLPWYIAGDWPTPGLVETSGPLWVGNALSVTTVLGETVTGPAMVTMAAREDRAQVKPFTLMAGQV